MYHYIREAKSLLFKYIYCELVAINYEPYWYDLDTRSPFASNNNGILFFFLSFLREKDMIFTLLWYGYNVGMFGKNKIFLSFKLENFAFFLKIARFDTQLNHCPAICYCFLASKWGFILAAGFAFLYVISAFCFNILSNWEQISYSDENYLNCFNSNSRKKENAKPNVFPLGKTLCFF